MTKIKAKFTDKFGSTATPSVPHVPVPVTPEIPVPPSSVSAEKNIELADSFKNKGNELLTSKKYQESIDAYSEAVKLSPDGPNSHIYYANRAAAYSQLCQFEEACADAEKAVALSPRYSKAHSRLGYAHYQLGRYGEAVASYRAALNLEPNNKDWQQALDNALKREEAGRRKASASKSGGGGGAMPDLAGLMNNPALASMLGGGGGLEGMMSNPAFMSMAQQVMSNPALMQSMMGMLGGGGPGSLDMNAMSGIAQQMMSDPNLMNQLSSLTGGAGEGGDSHAVTEEDSDASSGPDPSMLERLRTNPALQSLREDPELAEFFADMERGGMSAAMRHMSNPKIMQRVMSAMSAINPK
jgi:small glutamine-rich tetratricopeptide repeat-containing protein alpha